MTAESEVSFMAWLEWARRYADTINPAFPTAGAADRLAAGPEDNFQKIGVRDALKQNE